MEYMVEDVAHFFNDLKSSYDLVRNDYMKSVEQFFTALTLRYRVAKEVQRQINRYLASDFNLVSIMNPDENRISDLLSMLLDPEGPHGQGLVFLTKFLHILNKHWLNANLNIDEYLRSRIKVFREAEAMGLIDIQILFQREGKPIFAVGIENKPWAGDQNKQMKRYWMAFDRRYQEYLLLYISGDGRKPCEESISKEERIRLMQNAKLLCLSYTGFLVPWLRECMKECESDKVRWFLRDFIDWILQNFKEVGNELECERSDKELLA